MRGWKNGWKNWFLKLHDSCHSFVVGECILQHGVFGGMFRGLFQGHVSGYVSWGFQRASLLMLRARHWWKHLHI